MISDNHRFDSQVVERVLRGDKQAFNLLVVKYQQRLMYLVGQYVKHSGDIPDVVQDTFIKAYRSLDSFRGESSFYTWLYRIAVNTAKNYLAMQQRRHASSHAVLDDSEYLERHDALHEVANPENVALAAETEQLIFATIAQLPEELRTAITLREIDGLSYEDIAIIMNSPVGTVRSRIFRARESIDHALRLAREPINHMKVKPC